MMLRPVIVPPHTEEGGLFTIVESDAGSIARFGEELVLTTAAKYGSAVIEYKGREAGMAENSEEKEGDE